MQTAVARPQVVFLLLAAGVLAVESVALASRAMVLHPGTVPAAVIFDLCVVPALLWWALVVQRGLARRRTIARVAVVSVAFCALLFGREVRLLALPLELALLWVAAVSVGRALRARGAADAATALRTSLAEGLGDSPAPRRATPRRASRRPRRAPAAARRRPRSPAAWRGRASPADGPARG